VPQSLLLLDEDWSVSTVHHVDIQAEAEAAREAEEDKQMEEEEQNNELKAKQEQVCC